MDNVYKKCIYDYIIIKNIYIHKAGKEIVVKTNMKQFSPDFINFNINFIKINCFMELTIYADAIKIVLPPNSQKFKIEIFHPETNKFEYYFDKDIVNELISDYNENLSYYKDKITKALGYNNKLNHNKYNKYLKDNIINIIKEKKRMYLIEYKEIDLNLKKKITTYEIWIANDIPEMVGKMKYRLNYYKCDDITSYLYDLIINKDEMINFLIDGIK